MDTRLNHAHSSLGGTRRPILTARATFARLSLGALLLLGAAACGGSDDEPSADAGDGSDAMAVADAGLKGGMATVRILDPRTLEGTPDLDVAFIGPDGELIEVVTTDDEGAASATVLPGSSAFGFVERSIGENQIGAVRAVLDLNPGDDLALSTVPQTTAVAVEPPDAVMSLTLPIHDAGWTLSVATPCGQSMDPSYVAFYERCAPVGSTVPFVAIGKSTDGEFSSVVGSVEVADGGSYAVPGQWTAGTRQLVVTDLPLDAQVVAIDALVVGQAEELFRTSIANGSVAAASNGAALPAANIPGIDHFGVDLVLTNENAMASTLRRRHRAWLLPGDFVVELADHELPWTYPPFIDLAARTISFTATGGAAGWDSTFVSVSVEPGEGRFEQVSWAILAPPGVTELVLPELPAEYADYLPAIAPQVRGTVWTVGSSAASTWDEARQLGFEIAAPQIGVDLATSVSAN